MAGLFEERLPEELHDMDALLRRERTECDRLALDRIKLRAMAQAGRAKRHRHTKGRTMHSRLAVLALTLLLLVGTTAGGIAWGGGDDDHGGSAACAQYKPGNGYGDKNHIHFGPPGHGNKNPCDQDDHGNGDKGHGDNGNKGNDNKGNNGNDNKGDKDKDKGHHGH